MLRPMLWTTSSSLNFVLQAEYIWHPSSNFDRQIASCSLRRLFLSAPQLNSDTTLRMLEDFFTLYFNLLMWLNQENLSSRVIPKKFISFSWDKFWLLSFKSGISSPLLHLVSHTATILEPGREFKAIHISPLTNYINWLLQIPTNWWCTIPSAVYCSHLQITNF